MTDRMQTIIDKFEIQELLTAYAHAIDTQALDLLDDMFTADAILDYSATGGVQGGLAEIKPFLQTTLPMFKASQHFVTNPLIRLDGDQATSRSLLFNPMVMDRDGTSHTLFIGAWYNDALVRTEAGWRIVRRSQELAFFHNQ